VARTLDFRYLRAMNRAHLLSTCLVLAGVASTSVAEAQGAAPQPAPPPAAAAPQQYPPYPQYPPQPGYPPAQPPAAAPAYGTAPPYAQDDRWRFVPAPTELRYVEGRPIPSGYHLESRPRKGLVVAGPIVFGVPYFLSLSVAASSRYTPDRWLYLPIAGPFLDLAGRKEECSPNGISNNVATYYGCNDDSTARFFLMFDGLMQVSGMTMLIFGLAMPQNVLVRDDAPFVGSKTKSFAWSVAPRTFGRSGYGVGMAAIF